MEVEFPARSQKDLKTASLPNNSKKADMAHFNDLIVTKTNLPSGFGCEQSPEQRRRVTGSPCLTAS